MKVNLEQKLREIVSDSLQKIFPVIILRELGGYELFNSYRITSQGSGWHVASLTTSLVADFYTLKSAVAYCIFHYGCNISHAQHVYTLDRKLGGAINNLAVYSSLYKKHRKSNQSLVYAAKMRECELTIKQLTPALEKFYLESRERQLRKFRALQINTV